MKIRSGRFKYLKYPSPFSAGFPRSQTLMSGNFKKVKWNLKKMSLKKENRYYIGILHTLHWCNRYNVTSVFELKSKSSILTCKGIPRWAAKTYLLYNKIGKKDTSNFFIFYFTIIVLYYSRQYVAKGNFLVKLRSILFTLVHRR